MSIPSHHVLYLPSFPIYNWKHLPLNDIVSNNYTNQIKFQKQQTITTISNTKAHPLKHKKILFSISNHNSVTFGHHKIKKPSNVLLWKCWCCPKAQHCQTPQHATTKSRLQNHTTMQTRIYQRLCQTMLHQTRK